MTKRVLIITYYWPPSGGASVQRWLKFVKNLPNNGWVPVVYTVKNPSNVIIDESLLDEVSQKVEVIKTEAWEPYLLYQKFLGKKDKKVLTAGLLDAESAKVSFKEKTARWVRGNLFIPDARKYWIKPSVKYLENYLKDNPVDAIVSSGPPHSLHLIAMNLKKRFNLPWIADFRDPWTSMDYYQVMYISRWANAKHHRLEKQVITTPDKVLVIGNSMKREFETKYDREVNVLPNGFDKEKYDNYSEVERDTKFSLVHIGSLLRNRNPYILWEVLSEFKKENHPILKDLIIKLVGNVDHSSTKKIEEYQLQDLIERISYVPHSEALKMQMKAQVLLLLIDDIPNAEFVLSSKFFEYLGSKRPILCIGPTYGDAAKVLDKVNAGKTVGFKEKMELKNVIIELYDKYKSGNLNVLNSSVESYSVQELTVTLSEHLNEIVKQKRND